MKTFATILAAMALCGAAAAQDKSAAKDTIDLVFCIDCSGSMGPVINTAKQKVWAIVNGIAKDRPKAALRIGLIGYGDADRTYRKFELTDDLDEVYKNLMTMKDEGWGDEWVGLVVHKATHEMKWSQAKNVLKIIFVVGNETARQGPEEFDYTKTAPAAIKKDIIVNAVYCGDEDKVNSTPSWKEMAKLADLSGKLNTTYVGYGRLAKDGAEKQEQQDKNAGSAGGANAPKAPEAERAVAKSSAQYQNSTWDLVDALKEKQVDLEKMSKDELPAEMKDLKPEERKAYVEKKAKEREEIQAKIRELAAKRDAFIKEETQKQGLNSEKAFDNAVQKALTEQAGRKGDAFGR